MELRATKNLLKRIVFFLVGFVSVLVLIWLGAHLFTSHSQWARAIVWLDSVPKTIHVFPSTSLRMLRPRSIFSSLQQKSDDVTPQFWTRSLIRKMELPLRRVLLHSWKRPILSPNISKKKCGSRSAWKRRVRGVSTVSKAALRKWRAASTGERLTLPNSGGYF